MSSARLTSVLSSGVLNNRKKTIDKIREDGGSASLASTRMINEVQFLAKMVMQCRLFIPKTSATEDSKSVEPFRCVEGTSRKFLFTILEVTEEDSKIVMDLFGLSILYSSLFATILEDTIMQIRILGECNNALHIMKTMADISILIAKKYSLAQPAVTDVLDGIDQSKLWKEEYKLNKLAQDRKFFFDTMLGTYLDLSLNRSFECVAQQISTIVQRDNHYNAICELDVKLRSARREAMKQLRVNRIHFTTVNYDMDVVIDNLKSRVEDAGLDAETRARYITGWEQARTEQHLHTIAMTEASPLASIAGNKQRLDGEHRVHAEVMLLINLAINETMEKVEEIMTKYDKDMESMDLKIQIMRKDHIEQLEKRQELEAKYERHDKQSKAWIAFKDERQKAREYREKMTHAAIVAQAWWRGLLVRLEMGPYKVKKGKVQAAKAKGKK